MAEKDKFLTRCETLLKALNALNDEIVTDLVKVRLTGAIYKMNKTELSAFYYLLFETRRALINAKTY